MGKADPISRLAVADADLLRADNLLSLPEAKFSAIVHLLEAAPDKSEKTALLSELRPRTRLVRPQRRPSLERFFCIPFEHLLDAKSGRAAGTGPRQQIQMLWSVVVKSTPPERLSLLRARLREAQKNGASSPEIGSEVIALASAAFSDLDKLRGRGISGTLGELVSTHLRQGEVFLAIAEGIAPPPVRDLDDGQKELIAASVQRLLAADPALVLSLITAIASRMASPLAIIPLLAPIWAEIEKCGGPDIRKRIEAETLRRTTQPDAGDASPGSVADVARRVEDLCAVLGDVEDAARISGLDASGVREAVGTTVVTTVLPELDQVRSRLLDTERILAGSYRELASGNDLEVAADMLRQLSELDRSTHPEIAKACDQSIARFRRDATAALSERCAEDPAEDRRKKSYVARALERVCGPTVAYELYKQSIGGKVR